MATAEGRARAAAGLYLSTVTPVYRGAPYLSALVAELAALRERIAASGVGLELGEAIFVVDAPVDDSALVLAGLAEEHSWIRVLHLSRNYGQHPATVAGILHASGDWIATLDEDLQHPPGLLLPMLATALAGHHDVVFAGPAGPVHRSPFRNLSSRLFKRLVARVAGNPHIRIFNSFRLIRGSVARAAASVSTFDTYFDVALTWFTDRLTTMAVDLHDPRGADSGYGFGSLLRHARRLLISSELPALRVGTTVGLATLLTSLAGGVVLAGLKLARPELIQVRGWTSLMLAIAFFGGLTTFLAGLTLELTTISLLKAQGRPTFFVIDRSRDADFVPELERLSHGLAASRWPGGAPSLEKRS